jgi:transcriptional regulator with XRE-family HTH domain
MAELLVLGQRLRHFRLARGLTLDHLGRQVGIAPSQLSMIENGRREPRLSVLEHLASALGVRLADLLDEAPPTERAALEVELERMQQGTLYAQLGLPEIRSVRSMPQETLEALVGLHRELARRSRDAIATPEEARRANTELREHMRGENNHIAEIEEIASRMLRDIGHEAAALRFTNLATTHLGMTVHFLRAGDDGAVYKAYENDGLRLPVDVTGSTEGQLLCRHWAARRAFDRTTRTTEFHQYTDTPEGTFWESAQTGSASTGEFSITVGVPFADAKWFRGRETNVRDVSRCPDVSCCKRPPAQLAERWRGKAWSSAKLHAHILSPLPSGTFPGVDDQELYEFLETHSPR